MPTYEYECLKCGYEFEVFQNISDEPKKRCPKCRCKVKRLLGTGAGILFKGSGFYATDYRSASYQKGASDAKASASKSSNNKSTDSKKSKSAGSSQKTTAATK